jgi:protein-S-isoprenylcysteine O-methyltransferase Ste14
VLQTFLNVHLALWVFFAAVWVVAARFTKKTLRRDTIKGRLALLVPALVAEAFVPPFSSHWLPPAVAAWFATRLVPASALVGCVSVAITVLGIAFACWARYELGRNWSGWVTLKEDHHLITSGPYAIVRHPIYTGLLTAIVGSLLLQGTPLMLVVLFVLVLALRYKMSREEMFMSEAFGAEYAAYKQRARALVPLVW